MMYMSHSNDDGVKVNECCFWSNVSVDKGDRTKHVT